MATHDNASIARTIYESFNNRDFDRAASLMANDVEWRDMPTGEVWHGPNGFKQSFQRWATAFPDGKCEITNLVCAGDWCTVEFIGRGTNTGPMAGPTGEMPATGRRVEVPFCDVFEIKNGKVTRGHSYFDMATMLQQLGLMPMTRQAGQ